MFSGIVQGTGKVLKITTKKDHISFEISFPKNFNINLKKVSIESLKSNLLENNSTWWVVLGEEVDKVVGVANREKLLTSLLQGDSHLTPYDLSENVEFVPEMIRVDRLLLGFNEDKNGVRVVVDEFGGFVGLIGAEAVLAVLAGWWRKSNK